VIDDGMRNKVWCKKSYKEKNGNKKNGEKVAKKFGGAGNIIPPFSSANSVPGPVPPNSFPSLPLAAHFPWFSLFFLKDPGCLTPFFRTTLKLTFRAGCDRYSSL
jgi:hypothetical protein